MLSRGVCALHATTWPPDPFPMKNFFVVAMLLSSSCTGCCHEKTPVWLSNLLQVVPLHKKLSIVLACAICCSMGTEHGVSSYDLCVIVACLYSLIFFSSCILDHLLHTYCHSLSNAAGAFVSWMTATALQSPVVLPEINCRVYSVTVSFLRYQV